VAFLSGELLPGRSLEGLYWDLTREDGVRPFLLGAEESRVLLGALGSGPEERSDAARTEPSVLSILLRGTSGTSKASPRTCEEPGFPGIIGTTGRLRGRSGPPPDEG